MPVYTYTPIEEPFAIGSHTAANGINAMGQIVGYYANAGGTHGFLLSDGTYTSLDDPLASSGTLALGINAGGQIVGQYATSSAYHGFIYSGGGYTTLDHPSAFNLTTAYGINGAGQIVGYYNDSSLNSHGFLFTPNPFTPGGTYTPLDHPLAGARGTVATGINGSGQIVGYYYDSANTIHGFVRTPDSKFGGIYTSLDDPLGTFGTGAQGINDAGQIVGYYLTGNSISPRRHGFLYSGGNYITIDDPLGIGVTRAMGLNTSGQIVGLTEQGISQYRGFLLTITPNPSPPAGTTADMILRRGDGTYEIYDIGNNSILAGYELGEGGGESI
jgi:probable HAF family extracellular repeat protein